MVRMELLGWFQCPIVGSSSHNYKRLHGFIFIFGKSFSLIVAHRAAEFIIYMLKETRIGRLVKKTLHLSCRSLKSLTTLISLVHSISDYTCLVILNRLTLHI